MNGSKIVNINVSKLKPHPQNPRKQIGDVSELAESIKKNGILQNLTVVPDKDNDNFTIIIGHRRWTAAQLAGLDEIPCVIAEMDESKQIETMLSENMQRSDLTVYEEAEGFQMLLDLGFSIPDVAEKTGFSESTVRRRTNLLVLDKDKFEASQRRNPTLADYTKLDKIEDIEERNRLLEHIGTNNFDNEIVRAYSKQERKKEFDKIEECISKWATKVEDVPYQYIYITTLYKTEDIPTAIDEDIDYAFTRGDYSIGLYEIKPEKIYDDKEEKQKEQAIAEKQRKRDKFRANAIVINKRMHELRINFLKEYTGKKSDMDIILKSLISAVADDVYCFKDVDDILPAVGIVFDDEYGCINSDDIYDRFPQKIMLAMALCALGENEGKGYVYPYDSFKPYRQSVELNKIYNLLNKLGYQMSDEEIQLKEGTHEIFMVNKDEETADD